MRNETLIQFLGFRTRPHLREYTFQVRGIGETPLEFHLTIPHEAFLTHRARYQDAPDICTHWIQRELTATGGAAPRTRCAISDADLEAYRLAHTPKAKRGLMYKPSRDAF